MNRNANRDSQDKGSRPVGITGRAVFGFLDFVTGRGKQAQWSTSSKSSRNFRQPSPNTRIKSIYQPPPITPSRVKRPRSLTPTPSTERFFSYDEQNQSSLFKLPPAAFALLYQYLLGDRLIHIVVSNDGLRHSRCQVELPNHHDECHEQRCRGLKLPSGLYTDRSQVQDNFLPLLQTCRKIYSSAIHVLYKSNIFDFDSMESLLRLSTTILPQRFDSIQRLSLDFRFKASFRFGQGTPSTDWPRWERLWRVIGSMEGLQEVWVRIEWHKEDVGLVKERMWLDELSMVKRLKTFEVELPGLKEHEVLVDESFRRLHGEWEFVVRRRDA
ncbi:uncharacterized protein L3040_002481 [Drepanopeziza brunnea f. sp. 'multigermtubi']|uniref:DUF7730 domain-containing protein n=1 Tax=Marssonina brunnea f. sp. multigermtubi (strain MB_m1) TaxID=1072389 RepID=K1Y3R4_MARBU|nr:uncharacterized protein MBM_01786 [Drepanopeziza brunnea f. sp. 'multigermtubi' MB_m1]EKD19834.1 hypothetical protein MBM_01786 [Drepanopeziza brunnea f. sp. 'multigermtubi' MB_m1]KAJ5050605.1 hypothetical protein L3040_002481 [Drepanopeziza brunnea f. sp. 'multigermtubi']